MKILCENFLTADSTQSVYLPRALSEFGLTVGIRHQQESLYDTLDQFKPDYYLLHAAQVFKNYDVVNYIKDPDTSELKLIVACSSMNTQQVISLEESMSVNGIKSSVEFLFSSRNYKSLPKSSMRMVCLPECADDGLLSNTTLAFPHKIDTCVINSIETSGMLGSWHNVCLATEPTGDGYDYCLPLHQLSPLLKNYDNVIITTKSTNIPQICFDALLSGCNVTLRGNNQYTQESLDRICVRVFDKKLRHEDDQESIKNLIKQKHVPLSRAKTFVSQLSTNQRYFQL